MALSFCTKFTQAIMNIIPHYERRKTMKNLNKVREYWGYSFIFEDVAMMDRFIELFGDLFVSYEKGIFGEKSWLRIRVKKGVIETIKNGLGKGMIVTKHRRYYVKGLAA